MEAAEGTHLVSVHLDGHGEDVAGRAGDNGVAVGPSVIHAGEGAGDHRRTFLGVEVDEREGHAVAEDAPYRGEVDSRALEMVAAVVQNWTTVPLLPEVGVVGVAGSVLEVESLPASFL